MKYFLALLAALFAHSALAACGEFQVGHGPYYTDLIPIPYNQSVGLTGTPTALPAGTYHFCGNYYIKTAAGNTLATYHADIGTDPNAIESAPAGGSTLGLHRPFPGDDAGSLTFDFPIGCRNLTLDGNTRVYLHAILSFTPSAATVKGGAILNWCRMPD